MTTQTFDRLLKIPRLENGDKLTLKEFERPDQAMNALKKAELYRRNCLYGIPFKNY